MELKDAILNRRSIRRFTSEPLNVDDIKSAISVAKFYPSWKNTETTRFMLISDKGLKTKISECVLGFTHNTEIINSANMLILVLTKKGISGYERDGSPATSKGSHFESFDAGLATQNLMLALHEKGIGSVVLGIYDEEQIKEIVNLDSNIGISCLLPIGYPEGEAVAPKRHDDEEFLIIK